MLQSHCEKFVAFPRRIPWKELLALLFILLSIYFFRQERRELHTLIPYLEKADGHWITIGIVVTLIYLLFQAALFSFSLKAVQGSIRFLPSIVLFLKRNFLSVFLPGGSVATFVYLPSLLRKEQTEKHKLFQAAAIQGIIGILSVIIVGIPVIGYALLHQQHIHNAGWLLASVGLIIVTLSWSIFSLRNKGKLYQLIIRYFPKLQIQIEKFFTFHLSWPNINVATSFSIGIELTGIAHLYIAMLASGVAPSWEAAFTGYIISTLFLILSPFLKGLGAVELSLVYVLKMYGFDTVAALEITVLYRVFEFWLPLTAGLFAWAWKGRHLFLRLLPPALTFLLGAVNIISVLTPPIAERMRMLRTYLPLGSIHASNGLVMVIGLILIMTAGFLVRGLKAAWWLALLLSLLSLVGHLTKALDYEEALIALAAILVLLLTRKQYRLRSNGALIRIGLLTPLAVFSTGLLFAAIGYYWLDTRHFGIDFDRYQSLRYAFTNFILLEEPKLKTITYFAKEFILSLRILGIASWLFLFYVLVRPYIIKQPTAIASREKATFLLEQYGTSPVDHFKIDSDKLLFISEEEQGFISYKIANGFAIVLEEPVCAESHKIPLLREFEMLCRKMGLKPAFYRVDEDSLYYFSDLKKKKLLIGQEGILEIKSFSLEGRQQKSLRNGLNSLLKKGYTVRRHLAPLTNTLIKELKAVSDEWLKAFNKDEMVFSQGMFDAKAIRNQDIIALHDNEAHIVAFLNIIPDYAPEEGTYDLIRKRADAPAACMDALVINLVEYAREKELSYLNLGLVPMSGITDPNNTAERVVKYAYEKIRRFRYYQGLREFKEKYAHQWINKYLLYDDDFDLIQLPAALNKVMQPTKTNLTRE